MCHLDYARSDHECDVGHNYNIGLLCAVLAGVPCALISVNRLMYGGSDLAIRWACRGIDWLVVNAYWYSHTTTCINVL